VKLNVYEVDRVKLNIHELQSLKLNIYEFERIGPGPTLLSTPFLITVYILLFRTIVYCGSHFSQKVLLETKSFYFN